MAKQTFTTGQVLTAAQMTSLQQTAMGGGSTADKVASYVLLAADAGTTVIMNSASATTITVNTALFAAGDTVNIQNIGAGICTITAGTATVNTAGSLALNQYEGGVLYFRSTSTATFFDYVQTGAVSPLTTKGDVWGYSTLDARVPIGANDTVLTADSTQSLGLKWAAAASPAYTWTAFTPVMTQSGGLTFSTNNSRYLVIGDMTVVSLDVTISNSGTANNMIFYNPPTPPGPSVVNGRTMSVGTCRLYDDSAATSYMGNVTTSGSTFTFSSGVAKATPQWGATGSDFTLALASGDIFSSIYIVRRA